MYLIFLLIAFIGAYLGLLQFFPILFQKRKKLPPINMQIAQIAFISAMTLAIYLFTATIPDTWIANRILHMFGGGVVGVYVCFAAAHGLQIKINLVQLTIVIILIVSTLGVANELAEFMLQSTTSLRFAKTIEDTWLDLASNTAGILLGLAAFLPFWKQKG